MITLLVRQAPPSEHCLDTRFGGKPVITIASGFAWPACKTCAGPMQFLGRVRVSGSDRLALVFMCQNDPGFCKEWDANAGGNAVVVLESGPLRTALPPEGEALIRPVVYGVKLVEVDAADYFDARERWMSSSQGLREQVLGQWLGSPPWLQSDETPNCACCGAPMQFLAQLEEGPETEIGEMNFGGGYGYLFFCAATKATAKFLWQC